MMNELPIDMNNPHVREYLLLIRLQVLTPLSLLINIGSVLTCSLVADPSIRGIFRLYPAPISPKAVVIGAYVLLIYAAQIGYCVLLTAARKPETKQAMIKGVGFTLILSNVLMAVWAITWILQLFLASTILLALIALLLLYSNLTLLVYHPPTSARPLDVALIHAPMRFFLILPLGIMFEYSLFVYLGYTYTPTAPGIPADYAQYQLPGFLAVALTNLFSSVVIATRRDIVWCIAAVWICVSLWSERPKGAAVYITALVFTAIHPLALIAGFIYKRFVKTGRVALVPEDDALYRAARVPDSTSQPNAHIDRSTAATNGQVNGANAQQGPREVDPEELWG
ncbi:hypothetical protein PC9H_000337 [Pleurotus ostreatus]|uniref:Uncharacterized protein n=1 Tax=Pleurotus ostreatus TaxID=5322 RepID=A0A8H7A4K3_PLEOS|nr:uncharacterized protein PC9H_000337 [Pleurotus ostreatus]KAF7439997.1 hypothetical protein PC9H_000337 [Pleurotus ostreatus]